MGCSASRQVQWFGARLTRFRFHASLLQMLAKTSIPFHLLLLIFETMRSDDLSCNAFVVSAEETRE